MRKKILILAIDILLLCATVSSAWILGAQDKKGSYAFLEYGGESANKLRVTSKDIEIQVFFDETGDGDWESLGSSDDLDQSGTLFAGDSSLVIPNATLSFKIYLRNRSDSTITVKLTASGVYCDESLVQYADGERREAVHFFGSASGESYAPYKGIAQAPTGESLLINDSEAVASNTYNVVIFKEVEIPPTIDDDYIELRCSVYFDGDSMTNDCAGKAFYISSFGATQT